MIITYDNDVAYIYWYECRLTKRDINKTNRMFLIDSEWFLREPKIDNWVVVYWDIIYDMTKKNKIIKKMKWYKTLDFDSKNYAFIKCYK